MVIADNYFNCKETPLWIPTTFDLDSIPTCSSCILRLSSPFAGLGNLQANLSFTESPLATLSINGIQHNAVGSILKIPGAHKFGNQQSPWEAELLVYFQNTTVAKKLVWLCIPLEIGKGPANSYFSTLTEGEIRNDRPTLSSVLTKDCTFISYEGASMASRTFDDPRPTSMCDVPSIVTYYVAMKPAQILSTDFVRLQDLSRFVRTKPPKPVTSAGAKDVYRLCTRIQGIQLDKLIDDKMLDDGGVPTKAMKCVRLDSKKDIIGDKVYIGKNKPGTVLSAELSAAASGQVDTETLLQQDNAIQAGDIEYVLAIVIGTIIGLVVAATIAVFIYTFVYKRYAENQLYSGVPTLDSLALPLPSLPGFFFKENK